jgi:uncharacterized membrane protein
MWQRIKRVVRHQWVDDAALRRAMPADMMKRLQHNITASEQQHSGEIQVYAEAGLPLSDLWRDEPTAALTRARALHLFSILQVWDTANNNGVLIYLLLAEHAIEIVADRGLSERVNPHEWQQMVTRMSQAFQQARFEEGLTQAINEVSALLLEHFPLKAGELNPNERPDHPLLG